MSKSFNVNYIVYRTSSGRILRTGTCSYIDFLNQAKPGESVIEGTADDRTDIVVGGKVVKKTSGIENLKIGISK